MLEPIDGAASPPPHASAIVDQRAQQFIPELLVTRAGQTVEFRNSESTPHNVSVSRGASGVAEFDVSTDPGQSYAHAFTEPGVYEVSCDIHDSMRASIVVVDSPYYAVAGDFGGYQIMNAPPGRYRLRGMQGAETTARVVEVAGHHADADVAMR